MSFFKADHRTSLDDTDMELQSQTGKPYHSSSYQWGRDGNLSYSARNDAGEVKMLWNEESETGIRSFLRR